VSEQEVYLRFIDWLRQDWFPLPDNAKILPIIKAGFTSEEVSFLTGIPFSKSTLQELAELKQMGPVELKPKLESLSKKGALFQTIIGDTVFYMLNAAAGLLLRYSFWPGRTDERTRAMSALATQYYHDYWDAWKHTHHKMYRAIPIEGTIEHTHYILPNEEVAKVLDSKNYFSVTHCACRHWRNLDPDQPNCKHSTENCLHFDRLARYSVEMGMGREITREEAHEILRNSAEDGLVHSCSNVQERVDTICNCCRCCCVLFQAYHTLKHSEGMAPSNYRARSNPELCIGCGLCVKRCPMDAIQLEDSPESKNRLTTITDESGKVKELKNKAGKVAVLKPEICVGCGVCAYKCSTQSLVLELREVVKHPPKDGRELLQWVQADFKAAGVSRKSDR